MTQQWFVKTSKGQAGPFSSSKLRQLVADGKIKPTTLISLDGKKWVTSGKIKGLSFPSAEGDALAHSGPIIGYPEQPILPLIEQREVAYIDRFGPYSNVVHELMPMIPHIDVYIHPPHDDRDFTTLVTGGMSDNPMPIPQGPCSPRAELVMYVSEPTQLYIDLLRFLARLPYEQNTWFSYGSTMTNGQPPQPIFDGSVLDSYTFLPSIIATDHEIGESVSVEGDPLSLLWVVPISSAERELIIEQDLDVFYNLLDKHQHPLTVDPSRKSYVKRNR